LIRAVAGGFKSLYFQGHFRKRNFSVKIDPSACTYLYYPALSDPLRRYSDKSILYLCETVGSHERPLHTYT
jgi:hypothetical protein